MSLALNVFNEKTIAVLKEKKFDGTVLFVEQITKMWQIINVKSPYAGANLNNPNRYPIDNLCDEWLNFLQKMATSLKLIDRSKKGKRIRALTSDTANALHVSLNGLVELTTTLLERGMKYVCIGKLQSDNHEGEFGVFRQLSGGNYLISVEQVTSSLSLRRIKLYHKLNLMIVLTRLQICLNLNVPAYIT